MPVAYAAGGDIEQEKPPYDQAEFQSLLETGFRAGLKKALNDVEPVLEETLQHAGKVLNGRIKKAQGQLKVCTSGSRSIQDYFLVRI